MISKEVMLTMMIRIWFRKWIPFERGQSSRQVTIWEILVLMVFSMLVAIILTIVTIRLSFSIIAPLLEYGHHSKNDCPKLVAL